jgi:hypothetical protein
MPLPWLTEGEAMEIIVKRYKREKFCIQPEVDQLSLFEEIPTECIREEDGFIRPSPEDART